MNLNRVFLAGNLTRDPENRQAAETPVSRFTLAVNGYKEGDTAFVDCKAFGKTASILEHSAKGNALLIEGRLIYESWQGRDGSKKSALRVIAERIQKLDRRAPAPEAVKDTPQPPPPAPPQEPVRDISGHIEDQPEEPDDLPF